jgi:hypothetical protein
MKKTITATLKTILEDRFLTAMIIVLVLLSLAYSIYVGASLRPSDLQVAVHYTAFGPTGFYRQQWYYLVTFIVLGLLIAVMHTAIIVKMHTQGRRQMALLFAGISFLLVVIAFFMTHAVLKVAFL